MEQYPTKKMSIEEYNIEKIKQFGELYPSMNTPCKYCGKSYGQHAGLECPVQP